MEDSAIVELYWQRADEAIPETERKYGRYCRRIAYNITASHEDAEECVNDTWLGAWNAMPDNLPSTAWKRAAAQSGAGERRCLRSTSLRLASPQTQAPSAVWSKRNWRPPLTPL